MPHHHVQTSDRNCHISSRSPAHTFQPKQNKQERRAMSSCLTQLIVEVTNTVQEDVILSWHHHQREQPLSNKHPHTGWTLLKSGCNTTSELHRACAISSPSFHSFPHSLPWLMIFQPCCCMSPLPCYKVPPHKQQSHLLAGDGSSSWSCRRATSSFRAVRKWNSLFSEADSSPPLLQPSSPENCDNHYSWAKIHESLWRCQPELSYFYASFSDHDSDLDSVLDRSESYVLICVLI